MIYRLSAHLIQVAVPPHHTAGVRAELLRFVFRGALYGSSALLTQDGIFICRTGQTIPAAKGTHRILGEPQRLADLHITLSLAAKGGNSLFLFTGHINTSSSYPEK